jgi:hypothetical protein
MVWPATLAILTLHSAGRLVAAAVGLPPRVGSIGGEAAATDIEVSEEAGR